MGLAGDKVGLKWARYTARVSAESSVYLSTVTFRSETLGGMT